MFVIRSGLDARGTVIRFLAQAPDFRLVQIVIPALGPARPPIPSFSGEGRGGVKWLGHEVDQPPKSSAEVNGAVPPSPPPLCLNGMYRDSF